VFGPVQVSCRSIGRRGHRDGHRNPLGLAPRPGPGRPTARCAPPARSPPCACGSTTHPDLSEAARRLPRHRVRQGMSAYSLEDTPTSCPSWPSAPAPRARPGTARLHQKAPAQPDIARDTSQRAPPEEPDGSQGLVLSCRLDVGAAGPRAADRGDARRRGGGAVAAALSACGTRARPPARPPAPAPARCGPPGFSDTEKEVKWSNGPIHRCRRQDPPARPSTSSEADHQVTYTEDYNDNDEFFAKSAPAPAGQDTGLTSGAAPTGWSLGWSPRLVQKLDKANNPNASTSRPTCRTRVRQGSGLSLPWQSGSPASDTSPRDRWQEISRSTSCHRPEPQGQVTRHREARPSAGHARPRQGPGIFTDATSTRQPEIQRAKDAGQLSGSPATNTASRSRRDIAACSPGPETSYSSGRQPDLGYRCRPPPHAWSETSSPQQGPAKANAEKLITTTTTRR